MAVSTRCLLIGIAALVTLVTTNGGASVDPTPSPTAAARPDFGPNVKIFDATMPTSEIQAIVDAIAHEQVDDEVGTRRYALLFKPGTYGTVAAPLQVQVGYYTEVAGLGAAPTDV